LIVPPTPTPPPSCAELATVRERFRCGYLRAGGDPALIEHVMATVACESRWDRHAVSEGGHLGLAQFTERSWRVAGGGDWRKAHRQGRNMAVWMELTVPAEQWPVCWN